MSKMTSFPGHKAFSRLGVLLLFASVLLLTTSQTSLAETNLDNVRSALDRLVRQTTNSKPKAAREEFDYGEASRLLAAIDALLEETAERRRDTNKLPSKKDYMVAVPPWTETREDRRDKIRELLNSALEIVTDVPIVQYQETIKKRRASIGELHNQIATLRERKLDAPKDALLPGLLNDTVSSLDTEIEDLKQRIEANKKEIGQVKAKIGEALSSKGIAISDNQLDLLLDSVLGSDLIKLVAVFDAAKKIDHRLGALMKENSENLVSARRYFAMHAALFAMLLHSQEELLNKIDNVYLKRLKRIKDDVRSARRTTHDLLQQSNRPDQQRALMANQKAQAFAEEVADFYRDYLKTQREQIIASRKRTLKDLRIADNTYETVEASFQLHALIEDARASFDAIKGLEAPGFDQLFQNEQLKREFENLTRKLDIPSS